MGNSLTRIFAGNLPAVSTVVDLLEKETDLTRVSDFAKTIEAAKVRDEQSSERRNYWGELAIYSSRRLGELIIEGQAKGAIRTKGKRQMSHDAIFVDDIAKRDTRSRAKALAKIGDAELRVYITELLNSEGEVSKSGVLRLAESNGKRPAAASNTGEIEWYTPAEYIEMARLVMGSIDLDPASSDIANETVNAKEYYTSADDGLFHEWHGNVWMNPPYSAANVQKFTEKLTSEIANKNVSQAIALVNNATDTKWFRDFVEQSQAVCFKTGRIAFVNRKGESVAGAAQGQVFIYFGRRPTKFAKVFGEIGWIVRCFND